MSLKQAGEKTIRARQLAWAKINSIPMDGSYCLKPEHNLPWLSEGSERMLRRGMDQFGRPRKPGKICALHSSSALGLNIFGYWQPRDRAPLGRALGLTSAIQDVRFERKFVTGVLPRSPNLDAVLPLADGSIFAIESKFTEWFGCSGAKPLRDAYLAEGADRWAKVGLAGAQAAAESYLVSPGYVRLDVPQLLKHMLGLATQPKPWHLALIWYKDPCKTADQMESEIARFKKDLGPNSAKFSAMTYQELWAALQRLLGGDHSEYEGILRSLLLTGDRSTAQLPMIGLGVP